MAWIFATVFLVAAIVLAAVLTGRAWPGGAGSSAPGWLRWALLGGLGAVLVLVQFVSATTRVEEGNVGVVYEFGAITGELDGTGLKFHVPWADITQVDIKDPIATFGDLYDPSTGERVRQGDYPGFDASSRETQSVGVVASFNYRVDPTKADDLLRQFGPNWFRVLFENRMQTYIKAETTAYETAQLPRERAQVGIAVEDALRTDPTVIRSGVIIVKVTIDNFDLDDQFVQAIRDKQVAEQRAERALEEQKQFVTEAETAKQQTILQAEAAAQQTILAANADAEKVVIDATAEARSIELRANAQAAANSEIAGSLTPELIQSQAIANLVNIQWGLLPAGSDFLLDPANIGSIIGSSPGSPVGTPAG